MVDRFYPSRRGLWVEGLFSSFSFREGRRAFDFLVVLDGSVGH